MRKIQHLAKEGQKKNARDLLSRIEDLKKRGATARAAALMKRYNRRYL